MTLETLTWLGILAAVVVGLFFLGRLMAHGEAETRNARAKKAMAVLDARLAKGEISREDYEREKRKLDA